MSRRRRWLTIALPVVLLLLKGSATLLRLAGPGATLPDDLLTAPAILGALSVVAALSLLAGHRIGWLLALTIVGWDLAAWLVLWWIGEPQFLAMALAAICAVLLTSPEMRAIHDDRLPA